MPAENVSIFLKFLVVDSKQTHKFQIKQSLKLSNQLSNQTSESAAQPFPATEESLKFLLKSFSVKYSLFIYIFSMEYRVGQSVSVSQRFKFQTTVKKLFSNLLFYRLLE